MMLRVIVYIVAILAGIAAGLFAVIAIALIGGMIFPSEGRIDGFDAEQIVALFPALPMGAKIAILLSWFGGALAGAAVAKRIAGRGWAAWTLAGIFVVYVLINVLVLPMPGWMQAIAALAPLLGGLIANHLVADRDVAETPPSAVREPEPDASL
jgi:hypothetical protein